MWIYIKTQQEVDGPKNNQVCMITDIFEDEKGVYLQLKGYENHGSYNAKYFRPFAYGKSAFKEILNNFIENPETTDIKIKKMEETKK